MRMYDIIAKKRDGGELTEQEIAFAVRGYTRSQIPDFQMSALLMAIYLKGMTSAETAALTMEMTKSGDIADLSGIRAVKADKHSTGGVGDKTTLITAPIVAAAGIAMAKMSGRALGHTGGTIDKLEAIPGYNTVLEMQDFIKQVNDIGIAVIGQSGNITPADKKMYALRDASATVECMPLIAASIMSKKLAASADIIMLDVKVGSGAFMKTTADATALAKLMVDIGTAHGKRTAAIITNMDTPLGYAIGNAAEVREAMDTLRGEGPADLEAVALELAARIFVMAGMGEHAHCMEQAHKLLHSGAAMCKFQQMVAAQGGDISAVCAEGYGKAQYSLPVYARADGYITTNAEDIGTASVLLGAPRAGANDTIDAAAGIMLLAKGGEYVRKGDMLASLFCNDEARLQEASERFATAITYSEDKQEPQSLIQAYVDKDGVIKL